jgi:hyperosmotically inducible protein
MLAACLLTAATAPARGIPESQWYFADKQPASDDLIHDNVQRRLADDADVKGGGLAIDVKDGVVTLHGKLQTQRQIDKASKLAKKVSGVKKVVNEIQLSAK